MKALYTLGTNVLFAFNGKLIAGTIVVVDKGVWEDPNNVYYDIADEKGDWYKHVPEKDVRLK